MRCLLLKDNIGTFIDVDNSIEEFQSIVGEYIETICDEEGYVIICNEEGKVSGEDPTCVVMFGKYAGTMLVGPILISGWDCNDFTDIPERIEDNWERYFRLC